MSNTVKNSKEKSKRFPSVPNCTAAEDLASTSRTEDILRTQVAQRVLCFAVCFLGSRTSSPPLLRVRF